MRYHLATGLAIRDGRILLVASRYANHAEPLWTLPGGRQQHGELLTETAVREIAEETGFHARVDELAYTSESYDGENHFLNVTFHVSVVGGSSFDSAQDDTGRIQDDTGRHVQGDTGHTRGDTGRHVQGDAGHIRDDAGRYVRGVVGDHVVAVDWVPIAEIPERIVVGVVREPLVAYLRGALPLRYAGFRDAGISIRWPDDSS